MIDFEDAGHGYDVLGLYPPAVERARAWCAPLYDHYFRVESRGSEHLPRTGPAILVANHSGVLPVDGAMLWLDVLRRSGRVLRIVGDRFITTLPFVSTWMARAGVVSGTPANVRWLLEHRGLVAIFPEGVTGVAKPARDRYRLQAWRVGHAELAIRHQVPIVPVAIVGAEESWPLAFRLRLRPFGAPYLPVPKVPLPLPVRYHLRYGAPLVLHDDDGRPEDADDPARVAAGAARTRAAVEAVLEQALQERRA